MNKFIYISLIFFVFISFIYMANNFSRSKTEPKIFADYYCKYANEIEKNAINEIEKNYKVKCWGTGGGMPYFINDLELYFYVKKPGSIEYARELIVNMAEEYISQIHDHKKAKPYLVSFPFPIENIHLSLSFVDKFGNEHTNQPVNYVTLGNGKIFYDLLDYKTHNDKLALKESYDDAYKIVMGHPRPETLKPGPKKLVPQLNRDGSIAIPAVLNNDPNNPWPEKPS